MTMRTFTSFEYYAAVSLAPISLCNHLSLGRLLVADRDVSSRSIGLDFLIYPHFTPGVSRPLGAGTRLPG